MPAEWETHEATWLTWPRNKITWPGPLLKKVERVYVRMIQALGTGERVHLLVPDRETGRRVLRLVGNRGAAGLVLHQVRAVDTWIRDYGPIFVKRGGEKLFTKWIFNAWGGKYADLARDNGVVDRVDFLRRYPRIDIKMILEGGSIDMNGRGTCLTTEQCLLNKNRNASMSRREIEKALETRLGARKTIWLKEGIEGDDTDGHVDDITRFSAPDTVITAVEPDTSEKNHAWLDENLEILRRETNESGKKLKVLELPMPGPVRLGSRGRLPASYANFYIGNRVVLLPVYSHAHDRKAVSVLKKAFPGRRIVPLECTALVYGLGSIHCVTQQEPC